MSVQACRGTGSAFAIFICTMHILNSAVSAQNSPKRANKVDRIPAEDLCLTVEETAGLIFSPSARANIYKVANPQVRSVVHRVLEDDDLAEFHESAWRLLGYIGDEIDVKRLEDSLLNDFHGALHGSSEWSIVLAMFDAVGLMAGRKVKGADKLADRMMTPGYWNNAPFRWYAEDPPKRPSFTYYTLLRVLSGYALSLDLDMRGKVALVRRRIGEPDESQFGGYFDRETFFDPKLLGDILLSSARNRRKDEYLPVTEGQRWRAWSRFNGDLENPGPAVPPRQIPCHVDLDAKPPIPANETPEQNLKRITYRYYLNAEGGINALSFHGEQITDGTIGLLKATPQLQHLSLVGTNVTDAGLAHLTLLELPKLEYLSLSRSEKFTEQGLECVGKLTTLKNLHLTKLPNVNDDALRHLRRLKQVSFLNIKNIGISEGGLQHLGAISGLETLSITSVPLTGEGLPSLLSLKHLKELRLSGGGILNKQGYENLKKFTHLQSLVLWGVDVRTRPRVITPYSVEQLQQALPDTEVIAPLPEE